MDIPKFVLLDIDSTLLQTYGEQEGEDFNFHYKAHGYHPLLCYDGLTRDLIKIELRDGNVYTSRDVVAFMTSIFTEYKENYPHLPLFLRGDSGFAVPELYSLCEENNCKYVIRLKENIVLHRNAKNLEEQLQEKIKTNLVDYAVVYGEFLYQAKTWSKPRRVVCKIEKPANQLIFLYPFLVTNMELETKKMIQYYCNRGRMENFMKESKNGFDFSAVSSKSKIVNANRLQVHALAYNLFNWFRRLVLPETMKTMLVDTLRMKILKIGARIVHSARSVFFKLSSSFPYQKEFWETMQNIRRLCPKLE